MAIDRTFNFKDAVQIRNTDVDNFFQRSSEDLEQMGLSGTHLDVIADLLNGELDHVRLRRAIEKTLTTTTV